MYGALSGLIGKGRIEPQDSDGESRKKEYRITAAGREVLACEPERRHELAANGDAVPRGEGGGGLHATT